MRLVFQGVAATLAALSLATSSLAASVESVLYSFTGGSDGSFPRAALIADDQGALYGTTVNGGTGYGTVFKLTPPPKGQTAWTETVLYRFTGSTGAYPGAGLIADNRGALYGTASGAGSANRGVVFKLTPPAKGEIAWTETVLYSFTGGSSDGSEPGASLIADNRGALYGTTPFGGSTTCTGGCGTVFKLTPPAKGQMSWTETVLYRFTGGSDGNTPQAGLIADNRGALYGTTEGGGGSTTCGGGCGTVFKLTPPGKGQTAWTKTVLHSFTGSDGGLPLAGLIADNRGALYGTTFGGGSTNGGTVFELSPPTPASGGWTETVLYNFCSLTNCSDGSAPTAALIVDDQGALYGTTYGGVSSNGSAFGQTVFKLTPPAKGQTAWTETVLHSFTGGIDGAVPYAGLLSLVRARGDKEDDHKGALYGTTQSGGSSGNGTVFKVTL